jgi:sulfonate transport system substrate-binding protein
MAGPKPFSRPLSRVRRAAAVAAVAAVAASCGSTTSKSGSSSATAGSASEAAASTGSAGIPTGTVLNVGDQAQLIETLFKASGVENGIPYKTNFVEFGSGPLVDAGFAAHRIDVGFMGDLPAALAVQSGLSVKATAASEGIGADEFLVAKPGIDSISQLKGKRVAYTTGTAEQAFALRALATAGLNQQDVNQVNVTLQQLFTVLETGEVDASVISGGQEEKQYVQQHPGAKVLASNVTVKPASYDYELASTSALADPRKDAAVKDFVKRLIEASNWAYTHQSDYATAYLVDVQHETQAEAQESVGSGLIFRWVPIDATVQGALQNVVQLEAGTGAIKSGFNVSPLFDPSVTAAYNQIVQEVPQNAAANG